MPGFPRSPDPPTAIGCTALETLGENAGAVKQLLIERAHRGEALRVNLRRFMPMMLRPSSAAYWPLTRPNGIMSPRTPQTPPTITCGPIAGELVHRRQPADVDEVADLAVTAQRCRRREDHVIADRAVMPDMAVVHEIAAVADARQPAALDRADIHRHAFADGAAVADLEPRRLAAIAQILRRTAERCERRNRAIGADRRVAADGDMRGQRAVRRRSRRWRRSRNKARSWYRRRSRRRPQSAR